MAVRDLQSILARQAHRYRAHPQYCWLQLEQLGHIRLIRTWTCSLEDSSCAAVHLHLRPLRDCSVAAGIASVCCASLEKLRKHY